MRAHTYCVAAKIKNVANIDLIMIYNLYFEANKQAHIARLEEHEGTCVQYKLIKVYNNIHKFAAK